MKSLKSLWYTLDGYKTYAVALVTVLYAIAVVGIGQNDWNTALPMIFGGSGLGALRHAVAKAQ